MAGDDILINDKLPAVKALINNLPVNRQSDIRTIASTRELKRGDYITWDKEKWLIISEIAHKRFSYYKGIIQKCNYVVKFNLKGIIKEIPCILDSRYFDVETGKYFPMSTGKIILIMPYNREIPINQRFIKMGNAFKVISSDFTQNGLSIFTCDSDLITPEDDLINEVADASKYIFTISITNGETANVVVNGTLQLNVELKLNGEVVTDKKIVFNTSDSDIAIVDGQGLVTGINEGTCLVSAFMEEMPNIRTSIKITVQETIQDSFTYELLGDAEIKKGYTKIYKANKYNNGILVDDAHFDFTIIPGTTPASAYTLEVISDTECSITCNASLYNIVLKATDGADSTHYVEKAILLRAVF